MKRALEISQIVIDQYLYPLTTVAHSLSWSTAKTQPSPLKDYIIKFLFIFCTFDAFRPDQFTICLSLFE